LGGKACPELDCPAPADDAKTAICVKASEPGKLILSAMNEGEAACTGKTAVCTENDPPKGATTVGNSVPASKDGDTNSEDPAGA